MKKSSPVISPSPKTVILNPQLAFNSKSPIKNNEIKEISSFETFKQQFGSNSENYFGLSCNLISKKRQNYYKYEYNPEKYRNKLESCRGSNKIFDITRRNKCCYCVSIVVYFLQYSYQKYITYISTIYESVMNIKKYLPDWICRLYLDKSVFNIKDDYFSEKMNKIIDSDNVEVYLLSCENIEIDKTRIYRFLPLIDPTVAKVAVREADGYVGKLECHNIEVFSKSDYIFYFPSISDKNFVTFQETENDKSKLAEPLYNQNSLWLKLYNLYFQDKNIPDPSIPIYSILAGLFTSNLMLNLDYFNKTYEKVKENISKNPINVFESGFDEIFLYVLFFDIISIPANKKLEDSNFGCTNSLVIGVLNYKIYDWKDKEFLIKENFVSDPTKTPIPMNFRSCLMNPFLKSKYYDSIIKFGKNEVFDISFEFIGEFSNKTYSILELLNTSNFRIVTDPNNLIMWDRLKILNEEDNIIDFTDGNLLTIDKFLTDFYNTFLIKREN